MYQNGGGLSRLRWLNVTIRHSFFSETCQSTEVTEAAEKHQSTARLEGRRGEGVVSELMKWTRSQASNHWSVSIEPCDSWRILLTVSFGIVAGGYAKLRNWTGCLPLANRLILVETLGPFLLASFWTLQRSIFWCHAGGSKNFRMFFSVHAKHGRCRSFTCWHVETVSRTSLTQMPVAQCNYHFGSCTAARIPPQMQDISAKLVLFTSPPKKDLYLLSHGLNWQGFLAGNSPKTKDLSMLHFILRLMRKQCPERTTWNIREWI